MSIRRKVLFHIHALPSKNMIVYIMYITTTCLGSMELCICIVRWLWTVLFLEDFLFFRKIKGLITVSWHILIHVASNVFIFLTLLFQVAVRFVYVAIASGVAAFLREYQEHETLQVVCIISYCFPAIATCFVSILPYF